MHAMITQNQIKRTLSAPEAKAGLTAHAATPQAALWAILTLMSAVGLAMNLIPSSAWTPTTC